VLFGWLQVADVVDVGATQRDALARYPWLAEHPHLFTSTEPNVVYIGAERLTIDGANATEFAAGGIFPQFDEDLVLSEPGQRLRSAWLLPAWFLPRPGRRPLTCHENRRGGQYTITAFDCALSVVARSSSSTATSIRRRPRGHSGSSPRTGSARLADEGS
jgi:hypothetical protein